MLFWLLQSFKVTPFTFKTFLAKVCFFVMFFCVTINGFGAVTLNGQVTKPADSKTTTKADTKTTSPTATPTKNEPAVSPDGGIAKDGAKTPVISDEAKKSDPRIGVITKCDSKKVPTDPDGANQFIYECVKDVINIIVGVSVILAVISIMVLGIKSLNSFENQTSLNKQIAERLQGFAVGATILGLFAALISFINPTGLKFDKIFSATTIKEYQSLVDKSKSTSNGFFSGLAKGVTGDTTDKTAGTQADKTGSAGGGGGTGGGTTGGTKATGKTSKAGVPTAEEYLKCGFAIGLSTKQGIEDCNKYVSTLPKETKDKLKAEINTKKLDKVKQFKNLKGINYAVGDFVNITGGANGLVSATLKTENVVDGKTVKKDTKMTFKLSKECKEGPFIGDQRKKPDIKKGDQIIFESDCSFTDIK